mmetsp:Transcript_20005/g.25989  ORF Transcript_20005/g.25989 Transcript_20005/m.25989 type:complete len:465 (+) Transcript_20005:138-1532(+)
MASESASAEKLLNKLRKLTSNKVCANCLTQSRLGFQAVCVKYKTFICHNCKSAHQAYSHRVKSVTMSTWTKSEVEQLRKKNGGGNELARATWFAKMSQEDSDKYMPKENSPLDKYKELVIAVYERKMFYGNPSNADNNNGPKQAGKSRTRTRSRKTGNIKSSDSDFKLRASTSSSVKANAVAMSSPVEDLLDLGIGGPSNTADVVEANDMFASLTVKSHESISTGNSQVLKHNDLFNASNQPGVVEETAGNLFQNSLAQPTVEIQTNGQYDPFSVLQAGSQKPNNNAVSQNSWKAPASGVAGDPFANLHGSNTSRSSIGQMNHAVQKPLIPSSSADDPFSSLNPQSSRPTSKIMNASSQAQNASGPRMNMAGAYQTPTATYQMPTGRNQVMNSGQMNFGNPVSSNFTMPPMGLSNYSDPFAALQQPQRKVESKSVKRVQHVQQPQQLKHNPVVSNDPFAALNMM